MQRTQSDTDPRPQTGAGTAGKEAQRCTTGRQAHGPGSAVAPAKDIPPELTYGCVEWFDYKSHPPATATN
jgi:hypothetical protein